MQQVEIVNEQLELLSEKVIYWAKYKLLLIADLHLGKVNHFRRSGIPVPQKTNDKNIERLIVLLQNQKPDRVIFLGDLFHSHYNSEWEVLGQVISAFPQIQFELVIGNHDILSRHQYEKHGIVIHEDPLFIEPFILSHEPLEEAFDGYNLAGHVHPSVRLLGKGRQHMKLPCFHFNHRQGLLPAFGEFTGTHSLKPDKDDKVFVVLDDEVMEIG